MVSNRTHLKKREFYEMENSNFFGTHLILNSKKCNTEKLKFKCYVLGGV